MEWKKHFSDEEYVNNLKGIAEVIYNIDGEEAVNETYIRCLALADKGKNVTKATIRSTLNFYCKDMVRNRSRENDIFKYVRTHELIEDSAYELTNNEADYQKMELLLSTILENEIDSEMMFRALSGECLKEIAYEYGISYDALRKRVSRIRIHLNEKYGHTMNARLRRIDYALPNQSGNI